MILVRTFVINMFQIFRRYHWLNKVINAYLVSLIENSLLSPITHNHVSFYASGLGYHFCDIFLTEFSEVYYFFKNYLPETILLKLLQPFIQPILLANKSCGAFVIKCKTGVIDRLTNELLTLGKDYAIKSNYCLLYKISIILISVKNDFSSSAILMI